jgi:dihydrofolate synthase/folylpolyglutamate synthase
VPEQGLADCVERVQPAHEAVRDNPDLQPCTFFEAYLGIAALHFLREEVDIAIYETGLGGRLDATNLVMPQVAALTTIGLDHTYILGDTLDAIAREKAEISKPGVPLVVARNQHPEALNAIREIAAKNGAELFLAPEVHRFEPPVKARVDKADEPIPPMDRFRVRYAPAATGEAFLHCPLIGAHQAWNIGVAVAILEQLSAQGYTIGDADLTEGLRKVRWPGRFDLRGAKPWLVLDCAHNPDSARALATALREYLDFRRLALVVGMSGDKDIAGFARELSALSPSVVLTRANNPRALPPGDLQERAAPTWKDAEAVEAPLEAMDRGRQIAGDTGADCCPGS